METTKFSNSEDRILTIPNLLSLFRLALIPVIVRFYCISHDSIRTGLVLILSGATDIVDGVLARRFHWISNLGKILDPIADKLTQAAMLICLTIRFPLMMISVVFMVVKELTMAITGILVIRKTGVVDGADWHGKTATVLLYAMIILHVFWPEIDGITSALSIGACTIMIVISFALYGIRNIKVLKQRNH